MAHFIIYIILLGPVSISVFELCMQRKSRHGPSQSFAQFTSWRPVLSIRAGQGRAARCKCSLNLHLFSCLVCPLAFSLIVVPKYGSFLSQFLQRMYLWSFDIHFCLKGWCESDGCTERGRLPESLTNSSDGLSTNLSLVPPFTTPHLLAFCGNWYYQLLRLFGELWTR